MVNPRYARAVAAVVAVSGMVIVSTAACRAESMYIGGHETCGDWTQDGRVRAGMASWVVGYMSGMNAMSVLKGNKLDVLVGQSMNSVVSWMDNYCREHPLDPVAVASDKLLNELFARARASH